MNEKLYEEALTAINKLFGDTSVPVSTTRANLEALKGEIDTMLESLEH